MVLIHSDLKNISVSLWFQLVLEKNRKHEHKTKKKNRKKEKQSREWNGNQWITLKLLTFFCLSAKISQTMVYTHFRNHSHVFFAELLVKASCFDKKQDL